MIRGLYSNEGYFASRAYTPKRDLLGIILYKGETHATTKRTFVNQAYPSNEALNTPLTVKTLWYSIK